MEIRPIKEEEVDVFRQATGQVFMLLPGESPEIKMPPEYTLCAFEGGNLATTYAAWPMTMRFNRESLPVAGVTHITTQPQYRRRGYLRKITETHFKQLYEKGECSLVILVASQAAIYQRYGYSIVTTSNSYNIGPQHIRFFRTPPIQGTCRDLKDDEFENLVQVYKQFSFERTGYLHRSRFMWENLVLWAPPQGCILKKIVYEENGQLLGYIIYTLKKQPSNHPIRGNVVTIKDFAWLTMSAYRGIWEMLSNMDLEENVIWPKVPVDDPMPHLLLEPRMLRSGSADGLLGRIVDVEKCLPTRQYTENADLIFELVDELCPWNNGKWHLVTSPDGSSISRTTKKADLTFPIDTMTMLAFGQISATEAARMGRLDVHNDTVLPQWDKTMRTSYHPFCPDMF